MTQAKTSDTFFIAEQGGTVRAMRNGITSPAPVLDLSNEIDSSGERGLLGLAFSPSDAKTFYVDFTDKSGTIKVVEFAIGDNEQADLHTRRDILSIAHPRPNHNGGALAFGPDGMLYIAVGDGGGEGDPDSNGQNLTTPLGKILRIDPHPSAGLPYTVPFNNPFAKQTGAYGPIWAYGLRNPWRFSFDTKSKSLWIADVGQANWEEVDTQENMERGGQNYGWSLREGSHDYQGGRKPTDAVDPVYEYGHAGGACSVTGGYVYRGAAMPELTGRYLFGDYCSGVLSTLTRRGTDWQADTLNISMKGIRSFAQDRAGELYVMADDGTIGRIDAG